MIVKPEIGNRKKINREDDYDYLFFKIAITITFTIANRKGNRLGYRKSNRSDCLSLSETK